jgi:hypothetical protein
VGREGLLGRRRRLPRHAAAAPDDGLGDHDPRRFVAGDIGYLTQPVDVDAWIATVQRRYRFLAALTPQEATWAVCNPGHRHEVTGAVAALVEHADRHDRDCTSPS